MKAFFVCKPADPDREKKLKEAEQNARPKEIRRYKENGYIIRVFEARYGCALINF